MQRKIKNLIMLVLVVLLLGSSYLTIDYAKKHLSNNDMIQNMNVEVPKDIPNDNMEEDLSQNENNEMEEPPEKPDGEANDDMTEPPDMPEDNNEYDGNMENFGMMNDNFGMMDNRKVNLTYPYYIAFGLENLVLALIVMYLIMSKFNKKTFKETFVNSDKVIILVLSTIILTSILTVVYGYITNNFILNKENISPSDVNNSITYSSSNEITEDETLTTGDFVSTKEDENALLVSGNIKANLSNIIVDKTGDSDGGDDTSFYGINSAIIAKDGANLVLENITVTTNATGANGVFSYGGSATTNNSSSDGTKVIISDSKITTTKDNSGGIMTTGGGAFEATNLTVKTSGISSAAIRTDRGGGVVTVDSGTYTTTGQGSPTIYSTADVTVSNAKLISEKSEGIVIEGKNSVTINSCELIDSNTKLNGMSTTYKNIFLYQSMSGDAASGQAEFTAKDSKITTNNGDTLYVTNTQASINLENNTIKNNDSNGNFLRIQKDSWGDSGSNGGSVSLTLTNQKVEGNIVVDSISTLDISMKTNSYYEGTINGSNEAKSISLTLDKTSKIKLTGDSYVTSISNSDKNNSNIDFNGYKLYVNGKAIN